MHDLPTDEQEEEDRETQEVLLGSRAPAPVSCRHRRRTVQGSIATAALLTFAGGAATVGRPSGSSSAAARRSSVLKAAVPGVKLNKSNTGCENTEAIRFGSHTIQGMDECATLCLAEQDCVQFNWAHRSEDNCALLNGPCVQATVSEWDLYDRIPTRAPNTTAASTTAAPNSTAAPTPATPAHTANTTTTRIVVPYFDSHWALWVDDADFRLKTPDGADAQYIFENGRAGCATGKFDCPVGGVMQAVVGGPPLEKDWDARFAAVTKATPGEDGCQETSTPRVFASARISKNGMLSRFNGFGNEVLWALWVGAPLSLCTPPGQHDTWARYFQPIGSAECSGCQAEIFSGGNCAGAYASSTLPAADLGRMKRYVYSKIFKFTTDVVKKRHALLKSFSISGDPLIGVHMRRGDKIMETNEAYIGAESFAQAILEQCTKLGHSACSVYVASDDPNARSELQAQMPGTKVLAQDVLPAELYNVRNLPTEDEGSKDQLESSFIMDLSILVHADVFIGTSSSNVGRWVNFMRPENKTSISLDQGGSFTTLNC